VRLTPETLRKLVHYDPTTGIFRWLVDGRNQYQRKGRPVGCLTPDGRIFVRIEGSRYVASRLAFLYMTGRWPSAQIDHRNSDATDNRWKNIREASHSQNNANRRLEKKNRSGFKGVSWCAFTGRWRAQIGFNGRHIRLGRFDTREDAHAAYVAAAKKYFGEFARAR
jgi:hypothetical protein